MLMVNSEINRIHIEMKPKVGDKMNHICSGQDINTCDPNVPLFIVK